MAKQLDSKIWQGNTRVLMRRVRDKLAEANLFVNSDDPTRAFVAAEEAYMLAFEVKDYLDKVMTGEAIDAARSDT